MDHRAKYLYLCHHDKNAVDIAREMTASAISPLYTIKKIKEIFPNLSLMEAKEIVIIATTEYKSLHDFQGSLLPDLEEFNRIINKENEN